MPAPWMGGVCAGLAVHLGVSVALVRIIMICMTFVGLGFGVYLWLWVTVPEDSPERSGADTLSPGLVRLREERAAQVSRNRLLVAGVALIVAAIVGTILNATGTLDWRDMGAIIAIVSGITLVWSQSRNVSSWRSVRFIGAVFGGIVLLSLGVVMVASRDNPPIILLRGGLIGAALVAGVLFALVPMWLRTTKDLSQAQAQRVRESERADIAAHLHDSVLQALTLIRASAEDPARVRAIALTEERELRAWLYTGHAQAADSLDAPSPRRSWASKAATVCPSAWLSSATCARAPASSHSSRHSPRPAKTPCATAPRPSPSTSKYAPRPWRPSSKTAARASTPPRSRPTATACATPSSDAWAGPGATPRSGVSPAEPKLL